MTKVTAGRLKLLAQNYGLDEVREAAIELEGLRNEKGRMKNAIKKKDHVIRTIEHHNNRLENDNRAKTSVLEKFREENKRLREALEILKRDSLEGGRVYQIANEALGGEGIDIPSKG